MVHGQAHLGAGALGAVGAAAGAAELVVTATSRLPSSAPSRRRPLLEVAVDSPGGDAELLGDLLGASTLRAIPFWA